MKLTGNTLSPAVSALVVLGGGVLAAGDTDVKIQEAAKASYNFKTYLKDDDITVRSKGGVVTLTGSVQDSYHKSLAEATVASLPGVRRVVDDLEVKPGQPSENSDAWLTAKVKAALLFHRHVSAATTEVETRDGVVTLKGKASNQAQKDLTAECAKDVDGVKAVDNQMTVAAGEDKGRTVGDRMDDASVTAQVKSALLFHRSTRMVATKVKTRGGVVTLSGEARSAAEKDLLTRLAQGINGVRSVRNNMVVRK